MRDGVRHAQPASIRGPAWAAVTVLRGCQSHPHRTAEASAGTAWALGRGVAATRPSARSGSPGSSSRSCPKPEGRVRATPPPHLASVTLRGSEWWQPEARPVISTPVALSCLGGVSVPPSVTGLASLTPLTQPEPPQSMLGWLGSRTGWVTEGRWWAQSAAQSPDFAQSPSGSEQEVPRGPGRRAGRGLPGAGPAQALRSETPASWAGSLEGRPRLRPASTPCIVVTKAPKWPTGPSRPPRGRTGSPAGARPLSGGC